MDHLIAVIPFESNIVRPVLKPWQWAACAIQWPVLLLSISLVLCLILPAKMSAVNNRFIGQPSLSAPGLCLAMTCTQAQTRSPAWIIVPFCRILPSGNLDNCRKVKWNVFSDNFIALIMLTICLSNCLSKVQYNNSVRNFLSSRVKLKSHQFVKTIPTPYPHVHWSIPNRDFKGQERTWMLKIDQLSVYLHAFIMFWN